MPAGNQALPKKQRLSKRAQYLEMNRRARRLHTQNLLILWRENGLSQSRMGITVTRKVAGAVGRNRLKRLMRETFRRLGPQLPGGLDLVVIPKKGAALTQGADLQEEFRFALKSLKQESSGP